MLFSVVVSAYNASTHLRRCVDSILGQSFTNFELVLFDDASSDDTPEIMRNYEALHPGKIKAVISPVNFGPGGGKNEGMRYASGEYICFCDSDDYFARDYLLHISEAIQRGGHPDIVVSGFTETDADGNIRYSRVFPEPEKGLFQSYAGWSRQHKKEFIDKHNLFIPAGRVLEDVLFISAIILHNPSVASNVHAEYFYMDNPRSVSNTYMKSFINGVIELEMGYLGKLANKLAGTEKMDLLRYFALRCVCWHLLKSGSGVGAEAMRREYDKAFGLLNSIFPDWQKSREISWLRPAHERRLVRFVAQTIKVLSKVKLSRFFFVSYSRINLERFWPKL